MERLEENDEIEAYVKLPGNFYIPTPMGNTIRTGPSSSNKSYRSILILLPKPKPAIPPYKIGE